jgi:hypothetical protein
MPGGRRSDAARERAVLALLSCPTLEDAADEAGVSERTLRRWLRDDAAFQDDYRRARAAAADEVLRRLQVGAGTAVQALVQTAEGDDAVAVKAAVAVLDQLHKAARAADLEARLAELERRFGELEARLAAPEDRRGKAHDVS